MRLTFRSKLLAVAGIAAAALVLVLATGALMANRVERRLTAIQEQHLPRVELEPQLDAQLERLQRALQDSVAAHDVEALTATRQLEQEFLDRLSSVGGAVDPARDAALRDALEGYYATAHDVSARLIDGETGEGLVETIRDMQAKQARTKALLRETAVVDRRALADAFTAAKNTQTSAGWYQLLISLGCLVLVVALSFAMSRELLRSLSQLTDGFDRFGKGEFSVPLPVTTNDELGDVAREANRMAASLERLTQENRKGEEALKASNQELEAFSYSVAHDLRAPLRGINGFSQVLVEDYGDKLDDEARGHLERIRAGAERMGLLIDAMLSLSRVARSEVVSRPVDLGKLADAVVKQLRPTQPERSVELVVGEGTTTEGDPTLLRALLDNLLGNAWKFTGTTAAARIEIGAKEDGGETVFFVRDNGAGFDMAYADKLFAPFQRLHAQREFPGTGIGLATVQRIVRRHGGRIWAEGVPGQGATFYFTLGGTPHE